MGASLIVLLAILFLAGACSRQNTQPSSGRGTKASGPRVRAKVLTYHVEVPSRKLAARMKIAIHGDLARSGEEIDRWRLINTRQQTVTFVDTIGKTWRVEPFQTLVAQRRALMQKPMTSNVPQAALKRTGKTAEYGGVRTEEYLIQLGGYRRSLAIGSISGVPANLFPLFVASESMEDERAGVMAGVFPQLLSFKGFPVHDRSELPYGKGMLIIDKRLLSVTDEEVPAAWFEIPKEFEQTGVKAPAAGRPGASSPRSGQGVPAAGSRSSATTRKSP